MKSTTLMAALAAALLTGSAAFAGDLVSTTVTNAKGQQSVLYRATEPSIALYSGGRGAGMMTRESAQQLTPVMYSNNKGTAITLFRAE